MIDQLLLLLNFATPAWISACLLFLCAGLYWQQRIMLRRLDKHAESIGHMDAWADEVEEAIAALEKKTTRYGGQLYLPAPPKQQADARRWWYK